MIFGLFTILNHSPTEWHPAFISASGPPYGGWFAMATCGPSRSAAPELRGRLSLSLTPLSRIPTRNRYASVWSSGPLRAGPVPSSAPGWRDPFTSDVCGLDQPPRKRLRTDLISADTAVTDVYSQAGTYKSSEPPLISCDELANLLSTSSNCDPGRCNPTPIVLDLRSLATQMIFRIKHAVGMPCESRFKMRLVLPHLDAYLHKTVTDVCPRCKCNLHDNKQLVVIYTETGFEHSTLWHSLQSHLTQTHAVDARLLKGKFGSTPFHLAKLMVKFVVI